MISIVHFAKTFTKSWSFTRYGIHFAFVFIQKITSEAKYWIVK
jgi:hypothetical protein